MALDCNLLASAAAAARAQGIPVDLPTYCWQSTGWQSTGWQSTGWQSTGWQPSDAVDTQDPTAKPHPGPFEAFGLDDPDTLLKTGHLIATAELARQTAVQPGMLPTLLAMARGLSPWQKIAAAGAGALAAVGAVEMYLHSNQPAASQQRPEPKRYRVPTIHTDTNGARQQARIKPSTNDNAIPSAAPEPAAQSQGTDGCDGSGSQVPRELGPIARHFVDFIQKMPRGYNGAPVRPSAAEVAGLMHELSGLLQAHPHDSLESLLRARSAVLTGRHPSGQDRQLWRWLTRDLQAIASTDLNTLPPCDAQKLVDFAEQAAQESKRLFDGEMHASSVRDGW